MERFLLKKNALKLTLVTQKGTTPLEIYLKFLEGCVAGGVQAVQLREKNLSLEDCYRLGKALKKILDPLNVPLLINDYSDLARSLQAGVHLGQSDGCVKTARNLLGKKEYIGLTVNTLQEITLANDLPLHYVGVGPIFATKNKKDAPHIWGIESLRQAVKQSHHPVIAIGGIDEHTIDAVMDAGAYGVAAIGAFHHSSDAKKTAEILSLKIKKACKIRLL